MSLMFHKKTLNLAMQLACGRQNRRLGAAALTSLLAMGSVGVHAQESKAPMLALEEVVVTARRKDESLQDVPLTVNVVTSKALEDLNVRNFADLQGVVAGLTLEEDSLAPNASVRGVRFDTYASGFNPTVEFYLNDSPIVSLAAMQAMFDVAQIEVLRGPQGTLRGRAAPSGSITITTQRPDLDEFGGYVDLTGTDQGGQNIRGAVNIPLIEDKLAMRFAGFYESNDASQVETLSGDDSEYDGDGYRASVRFEPTDDFEVNLMYQRMRPERSTVKQVESAYLADASLAPSPILLEADDRKGVMDFADTSKQDLKRTGLEMRYEFANQQLNYAGSHTEQSVARIESDDPGEVFPEWEDIDPESSTATEGQSHELRLSSAEPLFDGLMDYVVGVLYQSNESRTESTRLTLLDLSAAGYGWMANESEIVSAGESEERSAYAHLTFYLTDSTELSAGMRRISYENESTITLNGSLLSNNENTWHETIYSASLKQQFTDNFMGYVSYGSSWRPGINVVGDFSENKTALEESFLNLAPETSDSYEIGFKSDWLDHSLRINLSAFYQEFENYPYRVGGEGVYFINEERGAQSVKQFNFVGAVPVNVKGVELETFYQINEQWDVSALMSWSKGEIDNGTVPCNDYGTNSPSVSDIASATGGDHLASCSVNYRSNNAPLWTTTLQSEYNFPIADFEAYVRGMVTLYGDSENDPANNLDDVDAYEIVNLYVGMREPEGRWEVMLYGKNLLDTERVLSREATPYLASYRDAAAGYAEVQRTSDYRGISVTSPREFGVNFRYNF